MSQPIHVHSEVQQQASPEKRFSITVENLSKRYNREWIFRNLNYVFTSGNRYAITGPNGSGKSTLLQILWGQLPPTSGKLHYKKNESFIEVEQIFSHVSVATPYMDLIDEFTLLEQLKFHFKLKPLRPSLSIDDVVDKLYLPHAKHKQIGNFSSGMKQRVKLGLAFFTNTPLLFLDEPGTNLDAKGFKWYHDQLYELPHDQLVILASNQPSEYKEDTILISMEDYK